MDVISHVTAPAQLENLEDLVAFVSKCAREGGLDQKRISEIEIATEEAFVNVISYAYKEAGRAGEIAVSCGFENGDNFLIEVTDSGMPFNVLSAADPDTSSDISDRKIGGLGIFLMKKLMDEVRYRYEGGKNVLTLVIHRSPGM
jgi:serine/threonine-protein kinase RsbW